MSYIAFHTIEVKTVYKCIKQERTCRTQACLESLLSKLAICVFLFDII
jgi:hypothetical protein